MASSGPGTEQDVATAVPKDVAPELSEALESRSDCQQPISSQFAHDARKASGAVRHQNFSLADAARVEEQLIFCVKGRSDLKAAQVLGANGSSQRARKQSSPTWISTALMVV